MNTVWTTVVSDRWGGDNALLNATELGAYVALAREFQEASLCAGVRYLDQARLLGLTVPNFDTDAIEDLVEFVKAWWPTVCDDKGITELELADRETLLDIADRGMLDEYALERVLEFIAESPADYVSALSSDERVVSTVWIASGPVAQKVGP